MDEEFATYNLDLSISLPFLEAEDDEFLTWVHGEIRRESDSAESRVIGRIHACLVDHARANEQAGFNLHDVLDQDLLAYQYAPGLMGSDLQLREDLGDEFGFIERILILDRIEVLPEFRGKSLGRWATYRLLDTFATTGVLPVMMPHPLQFSPRHERGELDDIALERFSTNRAEAFTKLRSYWRRIGFEKIGGEGDEEIWALNPTTVQPDRWSLLAKPDDLP
jgi:GNAT superfamily N-acetyltransferase